MFFVTAQAHHQIIAVWRRAINDVGCWPLIALLALDCHRDLASDNAKYILSCLPCNADQAIPVIPSQ
jgi:hypothetical protein